MGASFIVSLMELLLLVFIILLFISFYRKLHFGSPLKESQLLVVGWKPSSVTHWLDSRGGEISSFCVENGGAPRCRWRLVSTSTGRPLKAEGFVSCL